MLNAKREDLNYYIIYSVQYTYLTSFSLGGNHLILTNLQ